MGSLDAYERTRFEGDLKQKEKLNKIQEEAYILFNNSKTSGLYILAHLKQPKRLSYAAAARN